MYITSFNQTKESPFHKHSLLVRKTGILRQRSISCEKKHMAGSLNRLTLFCNGNLYFLHCQSISNHMRIRQLTQQPGRLRVLKRHRFLLHLRYGSIIYIQCDSLWWYGSKSSNFHSSLTWKGRNTKFLYWINRKKKSQRLDRVWEMGLTALLSHTHDDIHLIY